MPGWHAKTKELVADKKLKVLGIVQAQHPDRAALFMQWHQMDWPVMSDPLNLLGVKAIPHTFLIDQHGIIRFKNPSDAELATFLASEYPRPKKVAHPRIEVPRDSPESKVLWGNSDQLDSAIEQFSELAQPHVEDPAAFFRLGVAKRMRHDSDKRRPKDFTDAVAAWQTALELTPSQYIWRRRIQQYGPRLDKPYSFYDWVDKARAAVEARGEIPHPLRAEPSGSEFANATPPRSAEKRPHPDPDRKLPKDTASLIKVSSTTVASTNSKKQAVRVHLRFQPNDALKVHWTNDAGKLAFFVDSDEMISIHDFQEPDHVPKLVSSNEERLIEFEVRPGKGIAKLPKKLTGSAFYYVCEDVNGLCQYLRQDIEITLHE